MIEAIRALVDDGRLGAVATVVSGPHTGARAVMDRDSGVVAGALPEGMIEEVLARADALMDSERSDTIECGDDRVFIDVVAPKPRLVIFGAVHVAQPLSLMARLAGFEVTVCDAREAFANRGRFPDAHLVLAGWGHLEALHLDRRTYVVILSHDARLEDPVLRRALSSPVRYIGAIGSRSTAERRAERLRRQGFGEDELARIHGPVGIDLGGRSSAETAVSILAEMIRVRNEGGTAPGAVRRG